MGCMMSDALVRGEELLSAQEHELNFIDQARILKALAADLGQDTQPVIEMLARRGFDAALDLMANGVARAVAKSGPPRAANSPSSRTFH